MKKSNPEHDGSYVERVCAEIREDIAEMQADWDNERRERKARREARESWQIVVDTDDHSRAMTGMALKACFDSGLTLAGIEPDGYVWLGTFKQLAAVQRAIINSVTSDFYDQDHF